MQRVQHQTESVPYFDTEFLNHDLIEKLKTRVPQAAPMLSPRSPTFENIFDSTDSDEERNHHYIDQEVSLSMHDTLILLSFRLPVVVIRKEDGSFKLQDSQSPVYPAIFKLKNQGLNF